MENNKIFDQSDVLGIIVPGAGVIIGLYWVFSGPNIPTDIFAIQLGSLGVMVLAALAAGQLLKLVAWFVYAIPRYTPSDCFDRFLAKIPNSESSKLRLALDSAYALTFETKRGNTTLFHGAKWKMQTLLNISRRADLVDRADQRFEMLSGLSIAALVIAIFAVVVGIADLHAGKNQPYEWFTFVIAVALAALLGLQAGRWAFDSAANLIAWFAWLINQENWPEMIRTAAGSPKT